MFLGLGGNDSPFNIYPPKGRYMWRDMARLAARYDTPFQLPSQFPRNGLLAARVACLGQDQPWIAAFVRAAMRANFGGDRDIGQPEVIADLPGRCGDVLGQRPPRRRAGLGLPRRAGDVTFWPVAASNRQTPEG